MTRFNKRKSINLKSDSLACRVRLLAPGMVYAIEWSACGRGGRVEFTSASANKYLRRLQDEKDRLLRTEQEVSTYVLAEGEAAEPPPTTTGPCARRSRRSTGRRGPFATPCIDSTCRRFCPSGASPSTRPHPARAAVGPQGAPERARLPAAQRAAGRSVLRQRQRAHRVPLREL